MSYKFNPFTGKLDFFQKIQENQGNTTINFVPGDIIETIDTENRDYSQFEVISYGLSLPVTAKAGANAGYQVRAQGQSDVRGDEIWIFSGCANNSSLSNEVRVYNVKTNSWRKPTNVPVAIRDGGAVYDKENDVFYYGIGPTNYNVTTFTNTFWKYNPVANAWTELASFPDLRAFGTGLIFYNGLIYAFPYSYKDEQGNGSYSKVWIYNPSDDSWNEYIDLQNFRYAYPVLYKDTKIVSVLFDDTVSPAHWYFVMSDLNDLTNYEILYDIEEMHSQYNRKFWDKPAVKNGFALYNLYNYSTTYNESKEIGIFDIVFKKYLGVFTYKQISCLNSVLHFVDDTFVAIGGTSLSQKVDIVTGFDRLTRKLRIK